jgi:hypothetical protein
MGKKKLMADVIVADVVSSLRAIAIHGVGMAKALAIPSRRVRRKLYIHAMQKTVAHAVETTAARLVEFPLKDLNELLTQIEDRHKALLHSITIMWAKEILETAIAIHPDMHLQRSSPR